MVQNGESPSLHADPQASLTIGINGAKVVRRKTVVCIIYRHLAVLYFGQARPNKSDI
jgi:hypothetical protein